MRNRSLLLTFSTLLAAAIPVITCVNIAHTASWRYISVGAAILAWSPVVIGILVLVLYTFITNPPEYAPTRKYQYGNAILIIGNIVLLFEAEKIGELVQRYRLHTAAWIGALSVSLLMAVFQIVINAYLSGNQFSFRKEMQRTAHVKRAYKELCGDIEMERYNSLFDFLGIVYIVIHPPLVGMAVLQSALFALIFFLKYPQFKLRKASPLYQRQNFSIRNVAINYLAALVFSMILYNNCNPIASFLIADSAQLTTYIADNRVIREVYSKN